MKLPFYLFLVLPFVLSSCARSTREVWEDTKSCGRYMEKGLRTLMGKHCDTTDFAGYYDEQESQAPPFVLLSDEDTYEATDFTDLGVPDEIECSVGFGDPSTPLPGIEGFYTPEGELASLFIPLHFATDKYEITGRENLETIAKIARYLVHHPATYVFVEGHADERGAAAYNLALGSKRANSVRQLLLQDGVSPEQIHTISYGKERPLALDHNADAWKQNRRAQFKLYAR